MSAVTLERSVLFADIAGSTRLVVEHGDETARLFLVRYVGLLADAARNGGGEVVNRIGDEVFCIFPDADDAAQAAAAMHEAVEAAASRERLPRPIEGAIEVRLEDRGGEIREVAIRRDSSALPS